MWNWLRRAVLAILLVPLIAVAYISAIELWYYSSRNVLKAKAAAQKTFVAVCEREHLNPAAFDGPLQIEERNAHYAFSWHVRNRPDEEISIAITYLPYDVVYSMSIPLIQDKSAPFGGK